MNGSEGDRGGGIHNGETVFSFFLSILALSSLVQVPLEVQFSLDPGIFQKLHFSL